MQQVVSVTGVFTDWLILSNTTIGFGYTAIRGLDIPANASMWLNIRVKYSDGSVSPELWYYLSRYGAGFGTRQYGLVTVALAQDGRILNSSQPRVIQVKGYAKPYAVELSSWRLDNDFETAKKLINYFVLDGYTIDEGIVI